MLEAENLPCQLPQDQRSQVGRDIEQERQKIVATAELHKEAQAWAGRLATGPTFANGMTKNQLNQEWSMSLDQAIEAEAQAQALCMQTEDFRRAYRAFLAKQQPVFEGN